MDLYSHIAQGWVILFPTGEKDFQRLEILRSGEIVSFNALEQLHGTAHCELCMPRERH